jgi:hypothetical protein
MLQHPFQQFDFMRLSNDEESVAHIFYCLSSIWRTETEEGTDLSIDGRLSLKCSPGGGLHRWRRALDRSDFRWAHSTPAVDLATEMSDVGVGGLHRRRPADKKWIRWIWWRLDRNGGGDGLLGGAPCVWTNPSPIMASDKYIFVLTFFKPNW